MLPMDWRASFARILLTWSQADLVLAGAGVLLAIDLALLFAGMARFQRARLVLDGWVPAPLDFLVHDTI
jgi:hypothetical protein